MSSVYKRLLIFNDYFYPGYRGGGPIQSLFNLIVALEDAFDIYVVTSVYDLQTKEPYKGYDADKWNDVLLPESKREVRIYYASIGKPTNAILKNLLKEVEPATIYINGIYSFRFFLLPLLAVNKTAPGNKIVVCPRGMLQAGALAIKPYKKQAYLLFMTAARLLRHAHWHATNEEEAGDIKRHFPKNKGITIAANIPKTPYHTISVTEKEPGKLRLIYLSLIAEKKNLLLLLELMKTTNEEVVLHIYGPITDTKYWNSCIVLIDALPGKVQYLGDVLPTNVQEVISKYHALILLTKGENFGHAIYESLSVGRPVLTSNYTPWKQLEKNVAGLNMDILNVENCRSGLQKFIEMRQEEYNQYCLGASKLATTYYNNIEVKSKYQKLFA